MAELHLGHFLGSNEDFESAQYRILSGLQQVRRAYANNEIYPHLGEMIELYGALQEIVQRVKDLQDALPRKIKEVDLEARQIVYEQQSLGWGQMDFVGDLIHWALPHVRAAIEEGRAIFEFVEENLHLEEVGLVPSYVEEGYLFLPDVALGQLHILKYDLSIIVKADERYRSLRTAYVKSIPQSGIHQPPQRIKLELLSEYRDLPNPATYLFDTDLEFPFEPTVLPVAKRKLMQYLSTQTGAA